MQYGIYNTCPTDQHQKYTFGQTMLQNAVSNIVQKAMHLELDFI